MRLPEFAGTMRTTISSVKPIQRLRWLASIRLADLSDGDYRPTHLLGCRERSRECPSGSSPTVSGKMSG
jgi:hypothetical protein